MRVVEVFNTVQGEGSKTGVPACFVRLSGCNLWSGLEKGRLGGKGQCALWCDTYFRGGDSYTPTTLIDLVTRKMMGWIDPFVVITGGEPMLQLRTPEGIEFIHSLLEGHIRVALETNGTIDGPVIDMLYEHPLGHITVSPKPLVDEDGLDHVIVRKGTDLKVIVPTTLDLNAMVEWDFEHRFLQPMDAHHIKSAEAAEIEGLDGKKSNFDKARSLAQRHGWRISIQTHKLLGLP